MNLLAITASQNVGHIDWEPYIPMIFTRLLRSLDLPVCYKSMKSARNQTLWSSSVASKSHYTLKIIASTFNRQTDFMNYILFAVWIASVLSPKSSAQHYLSKFLGAVESYLHPANSGKWVHAISEVVVQLPKYLFDRLIYERYKPHPWKRSAPGSKIFIYLCNCENLMGKKNNIINSILNYRGASSHRKLFDIIRGIIQADRFTGHVFTHECYRYRKNFQAFS